MHSGLRGMDEQSGGDHCFELLLQAAKRHDAELLSALASEFGINITENGKNALFWIAGSKDVAAADMLIKAGCKVEAIAEGEASPLMHAAHNNQIEMVEFLLKRRADPNYADANGDTALSIAREKAHLEIVSLLEKHIATK